ncbi:MAG TPA: hypothetical protein VKM94_25935 [Blastocatellia bacterium]|nr:hypothetical protein [Blastocatellia bacterium]
MFNKVKARAATGFCALTAILVGTLVLTPHGGSFAQSGRKIPKKPPGTQQQDSPPPSDSSKSKEASNDNQSDNKKPAIPVAVVSNVAFVGSYDLQLAGLVTDGILSRLSETHAVQASTAGTNLNRKEASDLAKKSTDTYVLWFELQADVIDSRSSIGGVDPRSMYVDFVVFAPGSNKQKTSGHVYQRGRGQGGIPGNGPSSTWTVEYSLRNAGRETADRLLDALGLASLPQIPH